MNVIRSNIYTQANRKKRKKIDVYHRMECERDERRSNDILIGIDRKNERNEHHFSHILIDSQTKSAPFSAYYKIITFIHRMNWIQICIHTFNWLMEKIIIRKYVMSYFSLSIYHHLVHASSFFNSFVYRCTHSHCSFIFCHSRPARMHV